MLSASNPREEVDRQWFACLEIAEFVILPGEMPQLQDEAAANSTHIVF
ncbi:hypothetical protein CAter282_1145 [Collimonas arenae]|uniref:Uncharacterized protein n=1 Tax=Collimonas arenae TaxID=279058 RepID=A0A127PML2_9BURK|nr:hypothetical protein CAter10_1239 [Collimonas arenae]AMP08937.1 hypothetical protein CAter282_1145 [Collimonas arenae]